MMKYFLKKKLLKKVPKKINESIKQGKLISIEWNENKLNSLINDYCINIENDLKDINIINQNVEKCSKINCKINFS